MSDLDLLTVSGGESILLYSFGSTGSGQTSGNMDARLWCGDEGGIFVYNVPNHLYKSTNGGGTFTDIFPNPSLADMNSLVTAVCEYDERMRNPSTTGSGENTTEIFLASSSGSTSKVLSTSGSGGAWTDVSARFYNDTFTATYPVIIVDAIEDIKGTAGILAGNRTATPVPLGDVPPPNDSRIFRSNDGNTFNLSDTGLMPGQRMEVTVISFIFRGFQMDGGVAITDLENALT